MKKKLKYILYNIDLIFKDMNLEVTVKTPLIDITLAPFVY